MVKKNEKFHFTNCYSGWIDILIFDFLYEDMNISIQTKR